ncbi:MAG: hypothetical protein ABR548_04340 [Actinomycetota bacterium]|nr:hypothetical protein [Actinomycetota bacterium]
MRRAAALLVAFAFVVPACGGGASAGERIGVRTYVETIKPLAKEGGRVVIEGVRPGLSDLVNGRITGETFRSQAKGWRGELEQVRVGFAAAKIPDKLARAAQLFDTSLRGYVAAIDAFVAASFSVGEPLKTAIKSAVPLAERADKTYDEATAILEKERKRVGLADSYKL